MGERELQGRRRTLEHLQGLAAMREQDLRQSLARQQRLVHDMEQKLALLESYLQQYRQDLADQERQGLDGQHARQMHLFIARLAEVLAGQRQVVAQQQEILATLTQDWRDARAKGQGFAGLLQRLQAAQAELALRRLQKDLDAWSSRPRNGFC